MRSRTEEGDTLSVTVFVRGRDTASLSLWLGLTHGGTLAATDEDMLL